MWQVYITHPTLENVGGWNWEAIGTVIAGILGILTLLGLYITWRKNHLDNEYKKADDKYKHSLFYLEQIKSNLSTAVSILSSAGCDNIKWHQAINCIKTADDLKSNLTEKPHQHIFLTEYFNTSYYVFNVIKNIDDFRFFYGVSDYKTKDSATLYEESTSIKLDNTCSRISPNILMLLCIFMDKSDKAQWDISKNGASWEKVFNSSYFNKPMCEDTCTTTLGPSAQIIKDYIVDYKKQVEAHNKKLSAPTS
jgi:hypothetical protein